MARSNASAKIRAIAESRLSPKRALFDAIGDISKEEVFHSQVLVITYIQSEVTQGGIILPQKTLEEDRFQGTVGLVAAMGPGAFKDDNIAKFHGKKISLGDWVLFRPSDGVEMFIRSVPCRLFEDVHIKMRISSPDMYW